MCIFCCSLCLWHTLFTCQNFWIHMKWKPLTHTHTHACTVAQYSKIQYIGFTYQQNNSMRWMNEWMHNKKRKKKRSGRAFRFVLQLVTNTWTQNNELTRISLHAHTYLNLSFFSRVSGTHYYIIWKSWNHSKMFRNAHIFSYFCSSWKKYIALW